MKSIPTGIYNVMYSSVIIVFMIFYFVPTFSYELKNCVMTLQEYWSTGWNTVDL